MSGEDNLIQSAKAASIPQLKSGEYEWTVTHYELTGNQKQCVMMYGDVVIGSDHRKTYSIYCKMYLRKKLGLQSKLMKANLMVSKSTDINLNAFVGHTFNVTLKRQSIPNTPKSIHHLMWISIVDKIICLK